MVYKQKVAQLATLQRKTIMIGMSAKELPATIPPGSTIRFFRKVKDWSQQQLADQSGVNKSTVSRAERNQCFEQASLVKIAQGLGLKLEDLFIDPDHAAIKLLPKAVQEDIANYIQARIQLHNIENSTLDKKK